MRFWEYHRIQYSPPQLIRTPRLFRTYIYNSEIRGKSKSAQMFFMFTIIGSGKRVATGAGPA